MDPCLSPRLLPSFSVGFMQPKMKPKLRLKQCKFLFCFFKIPLFYYYFLKLFIYLFLAVLALRLCARAFSSCGKQGSLFMAVCGPLTIAASLVAEHRLQMRRLSNCGSRA